MTALQNYEADSEIREVCFFQALVPTYTPTKILAAQQLKL
jgi:hypothetical protein